MSMPSRAYTSFLPWSYGRAGLLTSRCQCPLGLIPHFYANVPNSYWTKETACQCPLGLIPHFYSELMKAVNPAQIVSMPSRAYTSFLRTLSLVKPVAFNKVSMPSRAYTSFLHPESRISLIRKNILCQCPLGLIPHFYGYRIRILFYYI